MTENNVTNGVHSGNAAFVAVPWAKTLRMEDEYRVPETWLQLYPVIASFAYPDSCYLSHDKMAAYSGMQKQRVGETLTKLLDGDWIYKSFKKKRNGLSPNYRYTPGCTSNHWYMIGVELVKKGVWAAMERTKQVIYSILQAWTLHPVLAASDLGFESTDGEFDYSNLDDLEVDGNPLLDCSFLPLSRYDKAKILYVAQRSMGKCSDKQLQCAIRYFRDNKLMIYNEGFDYGEDGFFFPRKPGLEWKQLKERLKKIEVAQADHKISYAAKRARHAAIKRSLVEPVKSKFDKAQ